MYNLRNIILFSLIASSSIGHAMEVSIIVEALFDACEDGNLELLKGLCKRVNNINNVVRKRNQMNQYSRVFSGGFALLMTSLQLRHETLLGFACAKDQFDIIKYLVEEMNADVEAAGVDFKSKFKDVPLARACSKKVRQYLFEHGADPYWKSIDGKDAEYFSFDDFEDPVGVAKAAIERGYDVNRLSATGETPLMEMRDNVALAECFINGGANVNFYDDSGITPLFVANERGCYNVARLLVEKGACLTFEGQYQKNNQFVALLTALYHTNIDFFNYLLTEEKIDIDMQLADGHTLLHDIASQSLADQAKEQGLWSKRVTDLTNKDLVVFLLCKGANPWIKNFAGQFPFEGAKHRDVKNILKNEESVRKAIIEHKFKDQNNPIQVLEHQDSKNRHTIEFKPNYNNAVKLLKSRELTGNYKLLSY